MSTDYNLPKVLDRGVFYIFHVAKDDIDRFKAECEQRDFHWELDGAKDGSAIFRVCNEPTPEEVEKWLYCK